MIISSNRVISQSLNMGFFFLQLLNCYLLYARHHSIPHQACKGYRRSLFLKLSLEKKKSPAWSKELASEGRCKTVKAHTEFLENVEAFLISEFAIQFQSPLILT